MFRKTHEANKTFSSTAITSNPTPSKKSVVSGQPNNNGKSSSGDDTFPLRPRRSPSTSFSAANPKRSSSKKANLSILNFFQKSDGPPPGDKVTQKRITQFGVVTYSPSLASPIRESNNNVSRKRTSWRTDPRRRFDIRPRDNVEGEAGLFLEDRRNEVNNINKTEDRRRSITPDEEMFWDEDRFNEIGGSVKRPKVEGPAFGESRTEEPSTVVAKKKQSGPFIDESDDDDDGQDAFRDADQSSMTNGKLTNSELTALDCSAVASLVKATTSDIREEVDDVDDIEDELDGEDFEKRLWMDEETRAFEDIDSINANEMAAFPDINEIGGTPSCPICQINLNGQNDTDIILHVNSCLDGDPLALPEKGAIPKPISSLTRLERAAIARPAQTSPFVDTIAGSASAFSRLMAGNAEDSAWTAAAANEIASRGKQSYERTCPFYKILPGFSICVDAFRYGSVEGCNAYFLSHFHSDHYMGLTAKWTHGPIYCSRVTGNLVRQQLKVDPQWVVDIEFEKKFQVPETGDVYVTMIPANHCPGSSLFLFEKATRSGLSTRTQRVLHCGDFRACPDHVQHPLLRPEATETLTGKPRQQRIDVCYLDTTYLNPRYAFPNQEDVINACADMCVRLSQENGDKNEALEYSNQRRDGGLISNFLSIPKDSVQPNVDSELASRGRLLVVIGTYSIGKERICLGIARALKSKIYAPAGKQRVCACLEDEELSSLLTDNPLEAQIHMQILFEIRAETLSEYLQSFKPHFSRVVGFRPTGWTYRPPGGRLLDNPPVSSVLYSNNWKTSFSAADLVPQRGSTHESSCFGVPYSEHSSFRELTMFCCALRIGRIIPTVNVGSKKSREKMKAWFERWEAEKRKTGLFPPEGW